MDAGNRLKDTNWPTFPKTRSRRSFWGRGEAEGGGVLRHAGGTAALDKHVSFLSNAAVGGQNSCARPVRWIESRGAHYRRCCLGELSDIHLIELLLF